MGSCSGTCEIVELREDLNTMQHSRGTDPPITEIEEDEKAGRLPMSKVGQSYSLEDDLNKLFEEIDRRTSVRRSGISQKLSSDLTRRSASKKPVGGSHASGIGVSECGTLKQALRGLCLSHASEMAAMKRLTKPTGQPRLSEAGTIKRLYRAVVVEASDRDPQDKGKESLLELSLVPKQSTCNTPEKTSESLSIPKAKPASQTSTSSPRLAGVTTTKVTPTKSLPKDEVATVPSRNRKEASSLKVGLKGKLKSAPSASSSNTSKSKSKVDEILSASKGVRSQTLKVEVQQKAKVHSETSISSSQSAGTKPVAVNPRVAKPVVMNKIFIKKKLKQVSTLSPTRLNTQAEGDLAGLGPNPSNLISPAEKNALKDAASQTSSSTSLNANVSPNKVITDASKTDLSSYNCKDRSTSESATESSRSREKGETSQSSKSSIGEYSSITNVSEDGTLSGSQYSGSRPHMSKDLRWDAIHHVEMQHGGLGLKHFKLLKRVGCGDIATVYLAELTGTTCLFALKVMDNELLASRKKLPRAQTEREILRMLDHPFLPTLFAYFTTEKYSCFVMEYCPGGDLHILRQRQPNRSFSEHAARFYLAEVLLALEYLHMLGVVYRDLKPENILVREDGHIMLSDFDLSLRCAVSPTLLKSSPVMEPIKSHPTPCMDSSCIDPFCLQPSCVQVPCFAPKVISPPTKTHKLKQETRSLVSLLPELVAEPTNARSNSFVGTHEYLAPEIIKAEGHGNAVDWWTFGIFLYELLFGRTPFRGPGNDETLANVVFQNLKFPDSPSISSQAKDLIRGLLIKDPKDRLGSIKGATEIRHHPFFEGLNWALIRCAIPPEMPNSNDLETPVIELKESECAEDCQSTEDHLELQIF